MAETRTRVLALLIALQLGLAAIGIVTVDESLRPNSDGLETATSADEVRPGDPATSRDTTSTPGATAPGGAAVPGQPGVASGVAGPIPAPRPGTYRFKVTTKNRSEFSTTTIVNEKTENVERRIERVSESAGEIIDRRHVPNRVFGSGEDGSKSEERSYEERSWRPDGASLRRRVQESTHTAADGSKTEEDSVCDWEPDQPQLMFPLRVGLEWSWESSCSDMSDGGESRTTNTGRANVTGTRDIEVGGRSVPTFIVELTAAEDTSGQRDGATFRVHRDQRTKSFFAPSLGLPVRIEVEHTDDVTFQGGQGGPQTSKSSQTATSELLNTEPA